MKLQPSRIHYSQNLLLNHQNAFSIFSSTKFHNIGHNAGSTTKIGGNFPKLQVFKKDGCYFALDNNSLSFYRQMELSKQNIENYTIDVVIVSSKKIPKAVLDGSACSADEGSSSSVSDTGEEGNTVYTVRNIKRNHLHKNNETHSLPKRWGVVKSSI